MHPLRSRTGWYYVFCMIETRQVDLQGLRWQPYGLQQVPTVDMCVPLVIGCGVEGDVDVGCGHLVVFCFGF